MPGLWAGCGGCLKRFEDASKLPRSQQEKIAAVIEAFVNQGFRPRGVSGKDGL